jgi:hypothetical protein
MNQHALMAGFKVGLIAQIFRASARTPVPIPCHILVRNGATEPLVGKELHVMYHLIVPTEPYANVRMIASQTAAFAPGEGGTLEERKAALSREARGLRNLMLSEAEVLRRDLSDKAFVQPIVVKHQPRKPARGPR